METSVVMREADLQAQISYMKSILNERQYRCYLGRTAVSLGRGGQALVARLSGSSINTVRKGVEEVNSGVVAHHTDQVASQGEAENLHRCCIPRLVKQ